MRSSLFRRVTRHPVGRDINPRENRLTEVTAAIVENVDGLAHAFVESLLKPRTEEKYSDDERVRQRQALFDFTQNLTVARVDIRTQVTTSQARFVDLEVLLRPRVGLGRGLLVWVEIKHGANLHGHQLDAYVEDIWKRPLAEDHECAVVVLAPRGWIPNIAVPREVSVADWQTVSREVEALSGPRPAEQDWLLSEYIRYLKEEGLSDPEALTTVSALSLMEQHAAEGAAAAICKYAGAVVDARWGGPLSQLETRRNNGVPNFGLSYWAAYPTGKEAWRDAFFEWGLRDTGSMDGPEGARGSWAFMAGATLDTQDNPTKADGNERWVARCLGGGFFYFRLEGSHRLARLLYPDELLSETSIETQGQALGNWAIKAFEDLAADAPPA